MKEFKMNNIEILAKQLNIKDSQVESALKLLKDGATIPFIARYRKEVTGSLDEEQLRVIENEYLYLENLRKRKEDIIRLITEKELMTDQLMRDINKCSRMAELEDIYRPFQEKKKTKASVAIKMGLEPLAKMIMSFPTEGSMDDLCQKFNGDDPVTGAKYIISEWISDNAFYRKIIKNEIMNYGNIKSKKKKDALDEKKIFEMYYEFQEPIRYLKHYHLLAMNRGEKEDILSVSLDYDKNRIYTDLCNKMIKNQKSFVVHIVEDAIKDSLKRLIYPSVDREIRGVLTEDAEVRAIETFQDNLEHLLMTKPIKNKTVLGFDPAFRTGCKLAVLNPFGEVLDIATIYPNEPKNLKQESQKVLLDLVSKYGVEIIAIGNGTASRESEAFVANAIHDTKVKYHLVSEAGASVYSASPLAIEEFPNLTVEKRSAISIGRRIQDPLSELVKIDPKSIGVGEYQHDVNQKNLEESLDFTVSKIVNEIGVNLNTASSSILKYISGLNKKSIQNILNFRHEHPFQNRKELKKITTPKTYEQAVGFLRIVDGSNPLDQTRIHPENYPLVEQLLTSLKLDIKDLQTNPFKETIKQLNVKEYANKLSCSEITLQDVVNELITPFQDYRDQLEDIILKSNVLTIDDLHIGMELEGTVRNVTSFGAFVDIGLHNDGLVHISKMSKSFVTNPLDIVKVGDIIKTYVVNIDSEKEKVGLSLIKEV